MRTMQPHHTKISKLTGCMTVSSVIVTFSERSVRS